MLIYRAGCLIACLVMLVAAPAGASEAEPPATAVAAFRAALLAGDADELRRALPRAGKIRVHLVRLGPENGALSAGQLHAVLSDFLARGSVRSFKLSAIERSPRLALATARLSLIDARGKQAVIQLHLSLEPEGDRWVLRAIRESDR